MADIFDEISLKQNPIDEQKFQQWYSDKAKKAGINSNPDDPAHKYDYRAAYQAGAEPEISKEDGLYHWPSEFKADDHPNRFINGQDTKYGNQQSGDIFDQVELPKPWYLQDTPVNEPGLKGLIKEGLRRGTIESKKLKTEFANTGERIKKSIPSIPAAPGEMAAHLVTMSYGVPLVGLGQMIDLATDGKYKVGEKIGNTLIYEPQTEAGQLLRDVLFSPATASSYVGEQRGDTLQDELSKEYGPEDIRASLYPAIRKTIWDIAGIGISGKGLHLPKNKTQIANQEAAPLDAAFAKDQVHQNIARQRAEGKPLNILATKEAGLKGEIKPEGYMAQNLNLFEDRIEMEKFRPKEAEPPIIEGPPVEPPIDLKTPLFEKTNPIYSVEGELIGERPSGSNAPVDINPAGPDFLEKATERLGGEVKLDIFDEIESSPEFGQKITDRSIPKSKKQIADEKKTEAIKAVASQTIQPRSAMESADIFDKILNDQQSYKGKVELENKLREEQGIPPVAEVSGQTQPGDLLPPSPQAGTTQVESIKTERADNRPVQEVPENAATVSQDAKTEQAIVTDEARRQEIKNSIVEGELILRTGKFNGRKFSKPELQNVQRSVDSAKAKLGITKESAILPDVTETDFGKDQPGNATDMIEKPVVNDSFTTEPAAKQDISEKKKIELSDSGKDIEYTNSDQYYRDDRIVFKTDGGRVLEADIIQIWKDNGKVEIDPVSGGNRTDIDPKQIVGLVKGRRYREQAESVKPKSRQEINREKIEIEQTEQRTVKDILSDINTVIGDKGVLGDIDLTPEQKAAYQRLSKDVDAIKRNAKRVGKDVEKYLIDLKYDPKVAELLAKEGDRIKKVAVPIKKETSDLDEFESRKGPDVLEFNPVIESKLKRDVKDIGYDIKLQADKYGGIISTRLANINPALKNKKGVGLRDMEFKVRRATISDERGVKPYMDAIKKLPKDIQEQYEYARKNSVAKLLSEIETKYGLSDVAKEHRRVLDGIHRRAKSVGYDMPYLENQHPREVIDYKGLTKYFRRNLQKEIWGEITKGVRAAERDMPRKMTPEEVGSYINSLMKGYGEKVTLTTRHGKKRTVNIVTKDIDKFYATSDKALVKYIKALNSIIEARRFFGEDTSKIKYFKSEAKKIENRIQVLRTIKKNTKLSEKDRKTYVLLKQRLKKIESTIENFQERSVGDSVGDFTGQLLAEGKIKPEQEAELKEILMARFNQGSMSSSVRAYKNLALIDTMGQFPLPMLTQMADIYSALYRDNWFNTAKGLKDVVLRKQRIKSEDLGFKDIAAEFEDSTRLGNAVRVFFKTVLIESMDRAMKETKLNSALYRFEDAVTGKTEKIKKEKIERFEKEIEPIFGKETKQVIEDLQNKNISENVLYLVFNDVLDFQPIALSEVPQKYLSAKNGKIIYTLKSYQIKLFDVYRNESFQKISQGKWSNAKDRAIKIEGFKNMARLTAILALCNATTDQIKDFILGRKVTFSENIKEQLWRLIGFSRWNISKAKSDGFFKALMTGILPPSKAIDSGIKDAITAYDKPEKLKDGLNIETSIPLIGTLYSWRLGKKSKKNKGSGSLRDTRR